MNVFLYQDDEWQQGENVGIGVVMVFVGSESIYFFSFSFTFYKRRNVITSIKNLFYCRKLYCKIQLFYVV